VKDTVDEEEEGKKEEGEEQEEEEEEGEEWTEDTIWLKCIFQCNKLKKKTRGITNKESVKQFCVELSSSQDWDMHGTRKWCTTTQVNVTQIMI